MGCEDTLKELASIQKYLQGVSSPGCQAQQAELWRQKLEAARIETGDEASRLSDTIKLGPWTNGEKELLLGAVSTALLRGSAPKPSRRALQQIGDFSKFLSGADLRVLGDTGASMACKLDQVVTRLVRLGIETPSEPSLKTIMATCIQGGLVCGDGSAASLHSGLCELKRRLRSQVKSLSRDGRAGDPVVEYPSSPHDLPPKLLAVAYAADDPPKTDAMDSFEVLNRASSISCRITNKLLRNRPLVPSARQSVVPAQGSWQGNPMMQMMAAWSQFMMNTGDAEDLVDFRPQLRGKRKGQLALPAPGAVLPDGEGEEGATLPVVDAASASLAHRVRSGASAAKGELPKPRPADPPGAPDPPAVTVPKITVEEQVATVAQSLQERSRKRKKSKDVAVVPSEAEPKHPEAKVKAKPSKGAGRGDGAAVFFADNPPPVIVPGTGAVYYRQGKISCPAHGEVLRVFLNVGDRNDVQIKTKGDLPAAWAAALKRIDDAAE